MDLDGDNQIDSDDLNDNGLPDFDEVRIVTPADFPGPVELTDSLEFTWTDSNKDGVINESEFAWIDVNGDGFVNIDRFTGRVDGLIDGDELSNIAGSDVIAYQVTTDPLKRDTDSDGVTDFDEIFGYEIDLRTEPRVGDTLTKVDGDDTSSDLRYIFTTDPTNFDTDGDTGSDGLEQRLGGNPNKRELGDFVDADGDGLVNIQERGDTDRDGVLVCFQGINGYGLEGNEAILAEYRGIFGGAMQGPDPNADYFNKAGRVISLFDDPDSDNDGLLDGEEYELGTNPREADTDGDERQAPNRQARGAGG